MCTTVNTVKFSVFSDLHASETFVPDGEQRLDAILERAKQEQVDFVIHCGDFCMDPHSALVNKYNSFSIPTYHVLGNHDSDQYPLEEVVAGWGMPGEYYYFDKNGFRFIVLNSNYYRYEDRDVAYSLGNYYKFGPYRDYVSREQVAWLEETVMASPYPMVLLSHNNLALDDKQGDALKNREEVQAVIRKAHENGKRILLCINGHFHVDYMRIYEHVCYLDMNSATMYWMPTQHHLFPEEYHEAHPGARNIAIYNDPVHAVITLSDDGTIDIAGMKSSYFCGVGPLEVQGKDCCKAVKITPHVMSEKLQLPMKL